VYAVTVAMRVWA